jgi:transmembrane sensor
MLERGRPLREQLRAPAPVDAGRLWQEIERRRHPLRKLGAWALAPALACALVALYLWYDQPPAELRLADGSSIELLAAESGPRAFALSDASRLELAAGSRLARCGAPPGVFCSELVAGKALFDVKPHGPRTWRIQAGALEVVVLGTRFSVERKAQFTRVRVERGAVQVTGAGVAGQSRTVYAGESVCVGPQPTAAGAACDAALDALALGAPAPAAATPRANQPGPDPANAPHANGSDDAASAARANEPVGALASGAAARRTSDRFGAARPKDEGASVEALLRAADTARVRGHAREAAALLTRIVERHPADRSAGLAAFTLGRLYLDTLAEPASAARAFERAAQLGLPQSLAEEGAARRVEAYVKAGQRERARAAAADYRARFANGARAAAVARFAESQ